MYLRSKWIPIFLCVVLILSLVLPSWSATTLANEGETVTLKILHTNDIHANIDGFGKIAAYLQAERQQADYSLYLDAGDIFSGNPVVDLQQGAPIIDLLNHMGLQALTIGNHEFDYGQESFAKNVQDSTFPWLSANTRVIDSTIPIAQPDPYTIFDLGGLTVGVLALTEAPPSTAPSGVVGIEFNEDYASVVREYQFLRDHVDVLIGLTHIGYPEDRLLAQQVDFFDVIIGGHSHTTLTQPVVVNGTPIAQTGGNATNVGNLTLTLNTQTKQVQSVEGHLQPVADLVEVDAAIQAKVDQYNAEMEEVLGKVIGYTNTGLTRDGRTSRDVALGNFWTDAMREMIGADIAVTNNGGIRDSIAPGEITAGDIYRVEPFANEVMEFHMTGQAIKDVIEFSYTREGRNQIDLQTSGLQYEIITDTTGNYIDANLLVNGQPINLEATYSVAVPDYIGTGGSGYQFVGQVIQPSAGFMTNAMIAYAERLMASVGAIDYASEGRIKVTIDSSGGLPGEVIGYTERGLSDANKAISDASLGNLYTDAVRAKGQADIGLLNGSSVTGQIPAGDITDEQIRSLDRFGNKVVVVNTTGERIKEVILSQSNFYGGVDLQVSGLHYVLVEGDGTAGTEKYRDVQLTLVDGSAFDLTATYTVAYNDYMHGRSFYNLGTDTIGIDQGFVWEAVVDYVRRQAGAIDYVEGQRIQIEGQQNPSPELPEDVISVAEAIANNSGTATVQGYIVGSMNWNFDGTTTPFQNTNLLLADQPTEREHTKILPVQLPQGQLRAALNLVDNPENLGKPIRLTGNLAAYFSQPGLRSPTAYEFVGEQQPKPEPVEVTIAEARDLPLGTEVVLEGIATTNSGLWGSKGFYLQDQTAGTYVFQNQTDVALGDLLKITAQTGEFNGEFQLSNVVSLEKRGTASEPGVLSVTPNQVSKANEGQLVILEDVRIENLRKMNDFGTFEFDAVKGNEVVVVRVDNRTGITFDDFTLQNGHIVDVTGISSQFRGVFQIKPRMASDIIIKDHQAPVTAAQLQGEQLSNGTYVNNVTVILEATDDVSGVAKTEYSYDGTQWNTYTGEVIVSEPGQVTVFYRSVDLAGNVEEAKHITFVLIRADFTSLYEYIEDVDFKNHGAKRSLVAHVQNAERHILKAEEELAKGKEKQAEQHLASGIKALHKVQDDLYKDNRGLSSEHQADLIRLVDLLIIKYSHS